MVAELLVNCLNKRNLFFPIIKTLMLIGNLSQISNLKSQISNLKSILGIAVSLVVIARPALRRFGAIYFARFGRSLM